MQRKIKTILVIRTTAMGDVAMTVPVIDQFLNQNPDIKIIFLTSKNFLPFFRYIKRGLSTETIDLHGRHNGLFGIFRIYKDVSSEYEIDAILDLQVKIYSVILGKIFKLLKGVPVYSLDKGKDEKKEIVRADNKVRKYLPKMVFRYADVFKAVGFSFDFKEIPYEQRREQLPSQYSFLEGKPLIGFSPMASSDGKQLPLFLVRSVIELLIKRFPDYMIVLFGGGRYEKMVGDSLVGFYGSNVCSTIGKMNISLEMDLMTNLDVMISMDSSAQHICSLLGTKAVTIWGATHPFTGFLGYSLNEVDNVVTLNLECSPCSVYGNKPCYIGNRPCLSTMTAEQIVDKVQNIIKPSPKVQ